MFTDVSLGKRGKIEKYQRPVRFDPRNGEYILHQAPLISTPSLTEIADHDFGFHLTALSLSRISNRIPPLRDNSFGWVDEPSSEDATAPAAVRFAQLRDEWVQETLFSSSTSELFMHPAYQKIIGLGKEGLPAILRDLKVSNSHWFWALTAIAGEDHAAGAESPEAARDLWLAWGVRQGYLN